MSEASGKNFGISQAGLMHYSLPFVLNNLQLSTTVMMIYDFILTFPMEIAQMWNTKPNTIFYLFYLNKYPSLVVQITSVMRSFWKLSTTIECRILLYLNWIFLVIGITTGLLFFTLRTFAIYGRNRLVLVVLGSLVVVIVVTMLWRTAISYTVAFPQQLPAGPNSCEDTYRATIGYVIAEFIGWITQLVFDAIVVSLTMYRTAPFAISLRKFGIKNSLGSILFRDGLFYYSIFFLPQFVQIYLIVVLVKGRGSNIDYVYLQDDLATVSNTLGFIMINRMILNLKNAAAQGRDNLCCDDDPDLHSCTFAKSPQIPRRSETGVTVIGGAFCTAESLDI